MRIDGLYDLPLTDFTAARNALVTRLRRSGRRVEADKVKGLLKPTVSAWAVNQLYRHHRREFDALLDTGLRFREAQAARLNGSTVDLHAPLQARRQALTTLTHLADRDLRTTDQQPTPEALRRVTTTLEALSVLAGLDGAPAPGRLSDDVDPPGFEALAALVPRVSRDDRGHEQAPRVLAFASRTGPRSRAHDHPGPRHEAQRQAALAAVTARERDLRDARKAAARAEATLRKTAARVRTVETTRAEAEARLERASAALAAAKAGARDIAVSAEAAAQAVDDAERALAHARLTLDAH